MNGNRQLSSSTFSPASSAAVVSAMLHTRTMMTEHGDALARNKGSVQVEDMPLENYTRIEHPMKKKTALDSNLVSMNCFPYRKTSTKSIKS